tara:strand:+ start:99463 stop:102372 length:2910 start_codon:yes stop_codon:yes gene_type:complete
MSARKGKKKKSLIKRILKYFGLFILFVLAALILIPIFFKDELKELALDEANKMLKATVEVDDFDLTFISTFPDMTLSFDGVRITGQDDFDGIKLVDLNRLEAELGFWSVIDMENIEIRSVKLIEPKIHVKVLENGLANYDIVKTTEELAEEEIDTTSSAFKLGLNHYEIVKGHIVYEDKLSPMFAKIVNLNHEGNGDLTAEVIDFSTKTTMDALTYEMDGISYLSSVKTDLDMDLKMTFTDESSRFELKENKLSLNALTTSFEGFYEMFEGYDDMDLKLNAEKTSFKDLLSLIPAFYYTGYESMVATGDMSLNGFVKGKMDDANLPAFEFGTKITGAKINYPDMPSSIDNIAVVAGAKFPGGSSMDAITVAVDQFKAAFVGNTIDANFYMSNPMTDPYMRSKVLANVDLSTLGKVVPLDENEEYNGKLTSDLKVDGRLSTLEKEEYEKFNAEGSLRLEEFHYASKDLPAPVDVKDMLFEFSPQKLNLANLEGKMGQSDFKMNGDVENYMAYAFNEGDLKGTFNYHSNVLNIDEIMPASETSATEDGTTTSDESEGTETSSESEEPVLVPANIDFALTTTVDELIYDGMDVKQIKGMVYLKDEEAILENLSMNTLGGEVGLSGKYNTQDHTTPKMDFAYSLKSVDINALATNFLTIEKLAPISKYAQGKITSDFKMTSDLKPSFEPDYNTLSGDGTLLTDMVKIEGFKPLDKLADVTKINKLSDQTLRDINASFAFEDGKVRVKPFKIKLAEDIETEVSGTTSFKQEIDYELKMNIPKEEIPGEIMKVAEEAIKKVKNIPGFEMKELPAEIPVTAFVTNTVKDPKIKTNMKEKIMELAGDVKGDIKDLIDEKVDEIKDTVKEVIDDKIEEGKEKLEKRKQKILDDAQAQADKIKADAKKLADKTREEGEKNAQKVIDEAGSNPLKKKAAELSAKKIREEANDKAQKIEDGAAKKADKIMDEARKRADALE